ncbi:COP9 signalosome subunit 8 (CsnH), putative [Trichophyton verrucosum HKI 0517]|uniref:COP9 signalosome subunit 8 (CsnH), putative n=1 Tax=Trichophyton verrucosum (strain HKI 0517) TaxID=663202 RepID=D4D0I4_TRIVH|nr:COP9 signalosome subunit 8 (CsnH), putative [Trichophyton verrucosum HKI 0517]EFE44652.1 COP9 signalosome subunit 8 (CsnH), putative [Trichophyton verrucosum HKI 0517]
MSSAPSVPERLTEILSTSTSPLESLIELEGEINIKHLQDGTASDREFLSTYYSSYLICLLLDDDIHEARMIFRRLPLTLLEDDTLMKALEKLVRAVGTRDHGTVYEILKTAPWHKLTEPLVQSYTVHYRNKVIDDTSLSYKTVRLPTIESKLGLEPDSDAMQDTGDDVPSQLIQDLSAKGWTYDSVSRLMHPARPVTQPGAQERITLGQVTALIGNHGSG